MVNPTVILGAIPLAALSSALYLPHDDDHGILDATSDVSAVQAYAVKNIEFQSSESPRAKRDLVKRSGCHKKSRKKHHKDLAASDKHPKSKHHKGKHHKGEHHPSGAKHSGIVSFAKPEDVIDGHYIVVLKKDAPADSLQSVLQLMSEASATKLSTMLDLGVTADVEPMLEVENGFELKHVHNLDSGAFRGFSGRFLAEVAEYLADHPDVEFVEKDSIVRIMKPKEEDEAPWGLARVSHRDPLGLSTYNKYLYDGGAGEGVTSYIVDTGIYIDHEDFEGRAKWGKTMPYGDSDIDAHGHGSHCAGTIGGNKYGVAKKANLVAVKVLGSDGSGTMSDVIGGVEYVVESHRREQKEKGSKLKGSTANMSLGGGKSPSLEIAVNAATEAGVHFAVAAGNENQDACNVSPAGAKGPVTVGATSVRDERAYFSNWGKCVDIFAPGVNVLSVGTTSPSSSAVMSGTSMASPHIAGLLTYFVSLQPFSDSEYATRGALSTKELKQHLIDYGTTGLITDLDSESPNVLAYQGGGKDISNFWTGGSDDEDEGKSPSFFDRLEESFEHAADYVEDLFEESRDLIGGLI